MKGLICQSSNNVSLSLAWKLDVHVPIGAVGYVRELRMPCQASGLDYVCRLGGRTKDTTTAKTP